MTTLQAVYLWLSTHPAYTHPAAALVALGVYYQLAHRPPPKSAAGRALWELAERLSITTWNAWGASLKWPGVIVPEPPPFVPPLPQGNQKP